MVATDIKLTLSQNRTRHRSLNRPLYARSISLKDSDETGHNLLHNRDGHNAYLSGVPDCEVNDSRLITSHNACDRDTTDWHGEPQSFGKVPAISYRQYYRQFGCLIEGTWGDHQYGTAATLLMASGRIQRHKVNISPLHSNSPPTAGASIHSRPSSDCGCE